MLTLSAAEEEFHDMPLEKAGRLLVQISRAEADRKRTDYAAKRKTELAFGQLEHELLAQIKQYPDLAVQMTDTLRQARARIVNEEVS